MAGLPVVKIALTIGKEKKKKGQSSAPQHHAVPDLGSHGQVIP